MPLKSYIASLFTSTAVQQMMKVGVVGVLNTVVSFAVFNLLLTVLGGTKPVDEGFNWEQFWAIAFSFMVATAFSYVVNRRWTFGLAGRNLMRRESARFLAINVGAWALTQVVVGGADALWGPLTRLGQNIAYLAAGVAIIVPKFAGYRDVVFRKSIDIATAIEDSFPAQASPPDAESVAGHRSEI